MRIDLKNLIADFPILKVRQLFRFMGQGSVTEESAAHYLKTTGARAKRLLLELEKQGFIEKRDTATPSRPRSWEKTMKGNALHNATAAKSLVRSTADKKLSEFLERVAQVRDDPSFLYQVEKAYVFGSYLSEKERINDVDLAVVLARKPMTKLEYRDRAEERLRLAYQQGTPPRNLVEQVAWPQIEVFKFLKSRSRAISLHFHDEEMKKHSKHQLLYEHPGKRA